MFKKFLNLLLFFLLVTNINLVFAVNKKNPSLSGINTILSQFNLPATVGIVVESLNNGKVLYQKNAESLFVPASNLKLFTAAATLLYLGPTYQFQTTLLTDAKYIDNGILQGNIYIKFSGDPSLTAAQLNNLIAALKQDDITAIHGNVYIDNSSYNDKQYAPGWMWDELNFCYAAPIAAIMINHNCFDVTLTPAAAPGSNATLSQFDYSHLTPIKNTVQTIAAEQNCSLELKSLGNNNYNLTGCVAAQANPTFLQIAIRNPSLYAKNLVGDFLYTNNVQLQGKILSGKTPTDIKILAVETSQPLATLVKLMLKNSDNQIANSLLMTLGEKYYQQPGTWENGVKALKEILSKHLAINFGNANLVEGAGISRYNMVTPEQLSRLLHYMYHNSVVATDFMASLPIAGEDGTLKDRMLAEIIRGKLRAKTGSMTGVSSLSGYVTTTDGKTLSFVILVNNFLPDSEAQVHKMEDHIGEYLRNIK